MYAYDRNLIGNAQNSFGWMLNYGVVDFQMELSRFYQLFLQSDYAEKFARGDSRVVAGMSGTEIAMNLLAEKVDEADLPEPSFSLQRTPEFWSGWALAHYQWSSGLSFAKINEYAPITTIRSMYGKYHEMDLSQFADRMEELKNQANDSNPIGKSALKRLRTYAGLSQSELAEITGVPVRTIQQYEQGQKDIRKANADYIVRLARGLYCTVESLLE